MTTRVCIAGGGVAALETLLALRRFAGDLVEVELVAPVEEFRYRPLSVAEPYGFGEPFSAPLDRIAADQGAAFRRDAIVAVDGELNIARFASGNETHCDAIVLACGARQREAVAGAITFMGEAGRERVESLIGRLLTTEVNEVVFALPEGAGWPLPLYELALLTDAMLRGAGRARASLTLVTPEGAPLEVFGERASDAVRDLLTERDIGLLCGVLPRRIDGDHLMLEPAGRIAADAVVALPRLRGVEVDGLPTVGDGFVSTDWRGSVEGLDGVFAAGDLTATPIKQGGLATQQADLVAAEIARRAGAAVDVWPERPVLRGMLLTGAEPRYLRAEHGEEVSDSAAAREPLWWPPGKIFGRFLAPYLAETAGGTAMPLPPAGSERMEIEIEMPIGATR